MLKKIVFALLAVSLLVGTIIYIKLDQFSAMGEAAKSRPHPAKTVTAMQVKKEQWEQIISATATVTAVQGVEISAETGGRVTHISFKSGSAVNKGELLVQLDTASEDAQLASARATVMLANANLKRISKLRKQNVASQDTLDNARAKAKEAKAQVQKIEALIAKKTVRAPFSGQLGLRLINLGEILKESAPIVSLQTLDPVYVDFSIPQKSLPHLKTGLEVRVTVDAAPERLFIGKIVAKNPNVDLATRSVRVRSKIANSDEILRAGMFATASVVMPEKREVLPIVSTAISYATFGDSVFVIEKQDSKQMLRQQFVRLGEKRGDFVEVVDGLKAGETVVTSGLFKFRSGMKVVIDNTLAPKASLTPNPAGS
jgi:membrane fusion protein (multidrug efflux system)